MAAVAFDPGWKATLDGRPVPVVRSYDGFVQFDVPAGRHQVTLHLTGVRADPLGLALSLAGLAVLLVVHRRPHRLDRGDEGRQSS